MRTTKLIATLLAFAFFMSVAGTGSADVISYSGNVSFDHDHVVHVSFYDCSPLLNYTFLSDAVTLSQFDPALGILLSVELKVESDIDVDTYYYFAYNHVAASLWWYSHVIGGVNGLQATISQAHNHHVSGQGNHSHVFTFDGMASDCALSGLEGFIGTGAVDVAITGGDKLCVWWNFYTHYDTDTYGTVTATLTYTYAIEVDIDIKPGSDPNSINLGAKGVVPVAVLTTPDFDAATVDPSSLVLSGSAARVKGKSGKVGSLGDVDNDGDLDLVVQFPIDELVLEEDATEAVLSGLLFNGSLIMGYDAVRIVPMQ